MPVKTELVPLISAHLAAWRALSMCVCLHVCVSVSAYVRVVYTPDILLFEIKET